MGILFLYIKKTRLIIKYIQPTRSLAYSHFSVLMSDENSDTENFMTFYLLDHMVL